MLEYRDVLKTLKVMPLDKLVYPEETSPEAVDEVKTALQGQDTVSSPIAIDAKSSMILSGVHTARALEELGFQNAVCQTFDAASPSVSLRTWYPVFCCANIDELRGVVATRDVAFREGMRDLRAMKAAFLLVFDRGRGRESMLVEPSKKAMAPVDFFASQRHALARFSQRHGIRYIPDRGCDEFLKNSCAIVLVRHCLAKKEVASLVMHRDLVLPPKTTRYIPPTRATGLGFPMEWLHMDAQEAQDRLDTGLRKRSEQWGIRLSEEPLTLIFNEYAVD